MKSDKKRRVVGLDEAGRGSIIGPLVIAAVVVDDDGLRKLTVIGVKDSKLLSPASRNRLSQIIKDISENILVRKIPPNEIDKYVFEGPKYKRLNYLEAITMGELIKNLNPDIAYVDASDTDPDRFSSDIKSTLNKDLKIVSVHHADRLFPIVSAASIIAKCERDAEVAMIAAENGFFGSGYPSDPRTRKYLEDWLSKHGDMPDFSRKSWKTWRKIISKTLEEF